jgi:hypothetical protein
MRAAEVEGIAEARGVGEGHRSSRKAAARVIAVTAQACGPARSRHGPWRHGAAKGRCTSKAIHAAIRRARPGAPLLHVLMNRFWDGDLPSAKALFARRTAQSLLARGSRQSRTAMSPVQAATARRASVSAPRRRAVSLTIAASVTATRAAPRGTIGIAYRPRLQTAPLQLSAEATVT